MLEGENDAGENIFDDDDMFPLHLQSQIRDPIGNKHQRGPGAQQLMRELHQVLVWITSSQSGGCHTTRLFTSMKLAEGSR